MKELITFVLKPLSFLPALAIMYIIYSFSGQTGEESGNLSYEVSVKIVEIGNQVLDKGLQDWEISEVAASIEYPVRKLAHMSEYFILAVAVSFPFYVYGLRGFPLMVVAGLICVGFAAGDEYHQSFVDGRGPSVIDVGIDSIGVFFGILTVRIVCFIFLAPARMLERRRRRLERKNARRSRTPRRSYGSYECRSAPANHYRYNSPEPREYSSSRKRRRYDDVLDDEYDDTFDYNDYYEDDYEEEDYREAMRSSRQRRTTSSSSRNISLENEWFGDHFEEQLGNEVKKFTEKH